MEICLLYLGFRQYRLDFPQKIGPISKILSESSQRQHHILDLFELIQALERAIFLDFVCDLEEILEYVKDLDPSLLKVAVLR